MTKLMGKPTKVCVDPGHGGHLTGGVDHGMIEKDLNLAVCLELRPILQGLGHTVVMTRTKDVALGRTIKDDVHARGCFSRNSGAKVFVSVHHDDTDNPKLRGCHGFAHRKNYPNGMDLATRLAEEVHKELGVPYSYGGPAGDWFGKSLGVMSGCSNAIYVTAALIECLTLSNDSDAVVPKQPGYPHRAALAIARGIQRHLGLPLPTGVVPTTTTVKIIDHKTKRVLGTLELVRNGDHIPDQSKVYVDGITLA